MSDELPRVTLDGPLPEFPVAVQLSKDAAVFLTVPGLVRLEPAHEEGWMDGRE